MITLYPFYDEHGARVPHVWTDRSGSEPLYAEYEDMGRRVFMHQSGYGTFDVDSVTLVPSTLAEQVRDAQVLQSLTYTPQHARPVDHIDVSLLLSMVRKAVEPYISKPLTGTPTHNDVVEAIQRTALMWALGRVRQPPPYTHSFIS